MADDSASGRPSLSSSTAAGNESVPRFGWPGDALMSPAAQVAPLAACTARHTASGVSGMSMCRTPRWDSASITALCTAGVEPIVPDSPIPLAPIGLRWVGVSVFEASNERQVGRRRDGVRGQVAAGRVAVLVERHPLVEGLRDALGDAAVLLARDEHRVEDAARVVDGDVAALVDPAGVEVDLDDGDVGAEREAGLALLEVELLAHRGRGAVRVPAAVLGRGRHLRPGDTDPVTPFTARPAVGLLDVVDRGLEQVGGDVLGPRPPARSLALWIALPPVCSDRDPSVPAPCGTSAVSDCTSRILSIGTSARSKRPGRRPSRGPGRARSSRPRS